jgi:CDGSH-type Zn-finger protein
MGNSDMKIKIIKGGPYIVTGGIPLSEKIITPRGRGYEYRAGRDLPQSEEYALCRCGGSKNMPFCDGSHVKTHFAGEEVAPKDTYKGRAERIDGPGVDLYDDERCAYARFCHREKGNVWQLTRSSGSEECRAEAIQAANDCPTGRLVAVDKDGNAIEREYEPSIEILQDPEEGVSAGIFVKGNIPVESSDGGLYETRNKAVLCRCGRSRNMPYCDASHVSVHFSDTGKSK